MSQVSLSNLRTCRTIPIEAQLKSQYGVKAAWDSHLLVDLGTGLPIRRGLREKLATPVWLDPARVIDEVAWPLAC